MDTAENQEQVDSSDSEISQILRLVPTTNRDDVVEYMKQTTFTRPQKRMQYVLSLIFSEKDSKVDELILHQDSDEIQSFFPRLTSDSIFSLLKEIASEPNRKQIVVRQLLKNLMPFNNKKRVLPKTLEYEVPNKTLKVQDKEDPIASCSHHSFDAFPLSETNDVSSSKPPNLNSCETKDTPMTTNEYDILDNTDLVDETFYIPDDALQVGDPAGPADHTEKAKGDTDTHMSCLNNAEKAKCEEMTITTPAYAYDTLLDKFLSDVHGGLPTAHKTEETAETVINVDEVQEHNENEKKQDPPQETDSSAMELDEESTSGPIHPNYYKLLDIFPEASPNYLKKMCANTGSDQQALNELISRLLEVKDIPRRQARPPSPRGPINVKEQLEILSQLLPDADPTFLQQKTEFFAHDSDAFRVFVEDAIERKNYPTKKEYLRKLQLSAQQKQYTTEFSIANFLSIFPDPEAHFTDPKRKPSAWGSSGDYAICFLRNHFSSISIKTISDSVRRYGQDLIKIVANLQSELNQRHTLKSKRKVNPLPEGVIEIPLLQEIAYILHKDDIRSYVERRRMEEEQEKADAKKRNLLMTCNCCFDDEVMPKNVVLCPRGCQFCNSCVQKSVEVAFGSGQLDFRCLADCSAEFSLQILQMVLEPKLFSKIALKKQVAEVKAAGIDDLEACPFCDFLTIPDKADKLFHCLNPECMKESCRKCRETSHLPLSCEEVEQEDEVKQRTYIENKMTEALLRKCTKCGLSFIKQDGCNKMRCTCGNFMCYVCGKSIRDYTHFDQSFNPSGQNFVPKNGLCPLYSNTTVLHKENIMKGIDVAKTELGIKENPSKLKNDPSVGIENYYIPEVNNQRHVIPAANVRRGGNPVLARQRAYADMMLNANERYHLQRLPFHMPFNRFHNPQHYNNR